jgi:hypothetical protein
MRLPTKFRQFLDETGGMTLFTGRFFSQEFRPRNKTAQIAARLRWNFSFVSSQAATGRSSIADMKAKIRGARIVLPIMAI